MKVSRLKLAPCCSGSSSLHSTKNRQDKFPLSNPSHMAASPHPNPVTHFSVDSPVTPPSSSGNQYSGVPPRRHDRNELLQHLAQSIPLSKAQVGFCREALALIKKKLADSGRRGPIDKEFDSLLSDRVQTNKFLARTTVGRLEVNQPKNRYLDVLPYDDTRVMNGAGSASFYINASYVVDTVHENLPRFIATQGPLPNTIVDFWEMVVQQRCPVIVMLTGLIDQHNKMVKCDNYFPIQTQESQVHGRFKITNKDTKISKSAVVQRLLEIEPSQAEDPTPVPVLHLQLDWPDYGIPASTVPVREMFKTLYRIPSNFGPFIVHCSAGIGRTGTYCTIDHTLRRILLGDFSAVNIENTVRHFRQQRFGMVQAKEQYMFCYRAVFDELQGLIAKQAV